MSSKCLGRVADGGDTLAKCCDSCVWTCERENRANWCDCRESACSTNTTSSAWPMADTQSSPRVSDRGACSSSRWRRAAMDSRSPGSGVCAVGCSEDRWHRVGACHSRCRGDALSGARWPCAPKSCVPASHASEKRCRRRGSASPAPTRAARRLGEHFMPRRRHRSARRRRCERHRCRGSGRCVERRRRRVTGRRKRSRCRRRRGGALATLPGSARDVPRGIHPRPRSTGGVRQ